MFSWYDYSLLFAVVGLCLLNLVDDKLSSCVSYTTIPVMVSLEVVLDIVDSGDFRVVDSGDEDLAGRKADQSLGGVFGEKDVVVGAT